MAESNRILAHYDANRNLVRISFAGEVSVAVAQEHEHEILAAIQAARPGFWLVTDLVGLTSMDAACAPIIAMMMDVARSREIGRVLRIIPDPSKDIGFRILSLFHYPRGLKIITCESVAEAEEILGVQ